MCNGPILISEGKCSYSKAAAKYKTGINCSHILACASYCGYASVWLQIRCAVDFLVVNRILDEKYYSETFHAISVQK